jgi:hypothetical protein
MTDILDGFHRTVQWVSALPEPRHSSVSPPTLTRRWRHAKQPLLRGTPTIRTVYTPTICSGGCCMGLRHGTRHMVRIRGYLGGPASLRQRRQEFPRCALALAWRRLKLGKRRGGLCVGLFSFSFASLARGNFLSICANVRLLPFASVSNVVACWCLYKQRPRG